MNSYILGLLCSCSLIFYLQNEIIFSEQHIANSFDYPVSKPDARGYYNAQKFGANNHLGEDWNAITGGNSDLGEPIFAIANGYVSSSKNHKYAWGNVIRIIHQLPDDSRVESLYAHCDTMFVREGQWVNKGDTIGTIGNADGLYYAHLHLEIRSNVGLDLGPGYSEDVTGYLNPTAFIEGHRVILDD